jgi:acyl carrier protein
LPVELKKTVAEVLGASYPLARMTESFAQIGMDSLEYLCFLVDVEAALDIVLPRSPGFITPQDVADWVAKQ